MSLDVLVKKQEFRNQFYNGVNFGQSLTEFRNNLAGSIMEKMQVTIDVGVAWFSEIKTGSSGPSGWDEGDWSFSGSEMTLTRDSGSFIEDGFTIGDITEVRTSNDSTSPFFSDKEVIVVTDRLMIIDMGATTSLDSTTNAIRPIGTTPLTAMKFNFGIIENNETLTFDSLVSGNEQGYYAVDVGLDSGGTRSTSFVDCTYLGRYKDWITGSAKVKYVSTGAESSNYEQKFQIVHELIVPWYIVEDFDNLQTNTTPEILNGSNSYKYVFGGEFRVVLSNPNTGKPFESEDVLGSVAWYGENFNGFQSDYAIKSVAFEDASTNTADGILISGETVIKITAEKLSGSFTAGDLVGVYISYLPTEEQYQDTLLTTLVDNFIYDAAFVEDGAVADAGQDYITYIFAEIVSGDMEITVKTNFSAAQSATLAEAFSNNNGNFLIGVQTGDTSISSGNSDAVINYYLGEFDQSPDIPDLMDLNNFGIFPMAGDPDVVGSYTTLEAWIEDGLLCEFGFNLDLSKEAVLNSLELVCLAYNATTGQFFEIDTYPININPIVKSGVQEIETTESRNYILATDDPYNEVIVETATKVGDLQYYVGRFAQKVPWQSWISNPDTDSVFYDKTKPENGLNLKSDQFSDVNDYEIHFGLKANLSGKSDLGVEGVTDYLLLSPKLTINGYDENKSAAGASWTSEIKTINPQTSVDLDGGLIDGQDTLIRAEWTYTGGAITDLTGIFAAIRIEETDQPGYAITELSNVRDGQANQLLYGSSNEKRLHVYLDSGKVVCEALVRGNVKISGQAYNLSAAIKGAATPPFSGGFDYINGFLIN